MYNIHKNYHYCIKWQLGIAAYLHHKQYVLKVFYCTDETYNIFNKYAFLVHLLVFENITKMGFSLYRIKYYIKSQCVLKNWLDDKCKC